MPSCRLILGSILVAALCDFVAFKYYPQGGSRFLWTFSQVKGNVVKLQNFTHKLADTFCNDPEECKNAADEFFAIAANLPKDVWLQLSDLMSKLLGSSNPEKEGGRVRRGKAMSGAVNYTTNEIQLKGDPTKAETVLKSLEFSSYDENNLCDFMEGIPPEEYDGTVDEIADLTNMPEKLRKLIKRAKNFNGKTQAVDKLQFKTKDGNLVFGRVAVTRRGKLLDMAYSLHAVEYKLEPEQQQTENGQEFQQFTEGLEDGKSHEVKSQKISLGLRDDFQAFFHKQAVEGFVKHCGFVLKSMRAENRDSDVLQHFSVHKLDKGGEAMDPEGEKGA